jgi:hypothetical protein
MNTFSAADLDTQEGRKEGRKEGSNVEDVVQFETRLSQRGGCGLLSSILLFHIISNTKATYIYIMFKVQQK